MLADLVTNRLTKPPSADMIKRTMVRKPELMMGGACRPRNLDRDEGCVWPTEQWFTCTLIVGQAGHRQRPSPGRWMWKKGEWMN